jgi:hypothetical protein
MLLGKLSKNKGVNSFCPYLKAMVSLIYPTLEQGWYVSTSQSQKSRHFKASNDEKAI